MEKFNKIFVRKNISFFFTYNVYDLKCNTIIYFVFKVCTAYYCNSNPVKSNMDANIEELYYIT